VNDRRSRPVVAVAGGPALLEPSRPLREAFTALGAAVATVDLSTDAALPPNTSALIVGDGAPVPHAAALSANVALRDAVVALHRAGLPIVAEGAGLGYLAERLDGHAMCDLVPAVAAPGRGGVPGTVELLAAGDGPLHAIGERRIGRPSAAITLDVTAGEAPAWTIGRQHEGWSAPGLHASLVVVPWTKERAARLLAAAGVQR
jgi:cobyrinic acid a,c-diamide synthase